MADKMLGWMWNGDKKRFDKIILNFGKVIFEDSPDEQPKESMGGE